MDLARDAWFGQASQITEIALHPAQPGLIAAIHGRSVWLWDVAFKRTVCCDGFLASTSGAASTASGAPAGPADLGKPTALCFHCFDPNLLLIGSGQTVGGLWIREQRGTRLEGFLLGSLRVGSERVSEGEERLGTC